MRSMHARMLAAFFFIIIINSVLLLMTLFLGYDSSRKYWNVLLEEESRKVVLEYLSGVLQQTGELSQETSRKILDSSRTFMSSAQIYLFSSDGELLRSWINPIIENQTPLKPDFGKTEMIGSPDDIKGYVQIIPLSFSHVKHNNIFTARLVKLSGLGFLASIVLSLMLAARISDSFTKEARDTARSLINLAEGSRREKFESTPTRELSSINKAAGSLQKILLTEEERRKRWSLSIAHDLKTPLTAMRTQLSACRDGALQLTPDRWGKIMNQIDAMENLTRDFMILGELEASKGNISVKKVKTDSLRQFIMDSLGSKARVLGAHIEWYEELPHLFCDFTLTCRALEALVKNALQHIEQGGQVEITVTGSCESPRFQVYNPGTIPEEHLPHIFDPLYKSDISRNKEGSGLGLTISKKIAEYHNGSLRVENMTNGRVCTTFSLNLG